MSKKLLIIALGLAACDSGSTGGITAKLVIGDQGRTRQALRAAAVPDEVGRLEIRALSADGSTLAVTKLSLTPSGDELQLNPGPAGGTWKLDKVPVGPDRIVRAQAFLKGIDLPAELAGRLGFAGQKEGIDVVSDETADAGTITLEQVPGVRIPRLDDTPPNAPAVTLTPFMGGTMFNIAWTRPRDPDVAGYLVAITGTSTVEAPAPSSRDFDLMAGSLLAPRVVVVAWISSPEILETTAIAIPGSANHKVFVYAYDDELDGTPRNFSAAAVAFAMGGDMDPPSPIGNLAVASNGADGVIVTFFGASDDTTSGGPPASYEVRASATRAELEDPARFFNLTIVDPPAVVPPGAMGMFDATFTELGQAGDLPFFVAMRAIDEAGNAGPIAVAQFTPGMMAAPVITAVDPEIAVAGQMVSVDGRFFGSTPGDAFLLVTTSTSFTMHTLRVSSWSNTQVNATIPANARSGTLVISRFTDSVMAVAELPILARLALVPLAISPVSEIASATVTARGPIHAVYEVVDIGMVLQHSVRLMTGDVLGPRFAQLMAAWPNAISATYSRMFERFVFAAATPGLITGALVSTSTAVAPIRRTIANVIGANGVGLALIGSSTTSTLSIGRLPAMIAFSVDTAVRTATVSDLAIEDFTRFQVVYTSTRGTSGAQLLYTGTPTTAEASFLAFRVGTGTTAQLSLWSQSGARMGGFTEDGAGRGPPIAERFVMLDLPGQGLVIVYEHRRMDGTIAPRILAQRSFGLGPGLAPYPRDTVDRRLADAGLVTRGGRTWIAIATVTPAAGGGEQLHYAEVDPATIVADGFGTTRGVRLDIALAANPMIARLGGKPKPVPGLPLIWNGENGGGVVYVRR